MTRQLAQPTPHDVAHPCLTCAARSLGVCGALSDPGLARLATIKTVIEVAVGQSFIAEGDPATCFFVVAAGTAKLFKELSDDRRQITGFAGPGQFLGLAATDNYAFTAEAIGPMRVCRFQRIALRALMDDFPLMEKRLLTAASDDLVAAQAQMLLLGRMTARERLASFLLGQSRQGMPAGTSRRQLRLPMSRGDLGDYLGLTIETISRTFTRLRAENLIDLGSHNAVTILDLTELEMLAHGCDVRALRPVNNNTALTNAS